MYLERVSRILRTAGALAALTVCTVGAQFAPASTAGARPAQRSNAHTGYVFVNGASGTVYTFDAATGGELATCASCGGWGIATDPRSGDIAVGAEDGSIGIAHVRSGRIRFYARVTLSKASSGSHALGITFDSLGNLYATDFPKPIIDKFSAATIASGGGRASSTYFLQDFSTVWYLASDGTDVLMDGVNRKIPASDIGAELRQNAATLRAGGDTLLNDYGLNASPSGIAVDRQHNLIVNNGTAISTYAKPWNGSPTSTYKQCGGNPNSYCVAIALDPAQTTLWATESEARNRASAAVGLTYPLGRTTGVSTPAAIDSFIGITLSPAR